jgi:hypothetical protein
VAVVQYTYTQKQYRERHKTNITEQHKKYIEQRKKCIEQHKKYIEQQQKIRKSAGRAPSLLSYEFY